MTTTTQPDTRDQIMTPERARRILGVHPGASPSEVDRAFRRCVRQAHPDHGGDADRFLAVLAARAMLAAPSVGGRARAPLVVVRRLPWWRRLLRAVLDLMVRRPADPPRVQ